MNADYLEQLANIADPDQLWKLPALQHLDLPPAKRHQLDTGVALRRHAAHIRQLNALLEQRRSLLITPISSNNTAQRSIETTKDHQTLLQQYSRHS